MRHRHFRIDCTLFLCLIIGLAANRSFATTFATTVVEPIEICRILPKHRDFRNLQSLIHRYNKGQNLPIRSMTYMEFAEVVNVLIDEMNDRLNQDTHSIDRHDIDTVKIIQERFAPELAILRQRMGLVEIRQACNVD